MEEILLPEPDREGYLFLGWSETPEDKGEYITSYEAGTQGDKTLYAMWESDTDAEAPDLISKEEEQLLSQHKDAAKDSNRFKKELRQAAAKKKKQHINIEKNTEHTVLQQEIKDSQAEGAEAEPREDRIALKEKAVTEQAKAEEKIEQSTQSQAVSQKGQERKPAFWAILLFVSGFLCVIGSSGTMLYFQWQKKGE